MKFSKRLIGFIGVAILPTLLIGLILLFYSNPSALNELKIISISSFNIEGLKMRIWIALLCYIIVGLAISIFCLSLLKLPINKTTNKIGLILLTISGISWFLLGLLPYKAGLESDIFFLWINIGVTLISSSLGLILLGIEPKEIIYNRFFRNFTFFCGAFIIIESLISVKVENSGISSSISWLLFFLWFGVTGILFKVENKETN